MGGGAAGQSSDRKDGCARRRLRTTSAVVFSSLRGTAGVVVAAASVAASEDLPAAFAGASVSSVWRSANVVLPDVVKGGWPNPRAPAFIEMPVSTITKNMSTTTGIESLIMLTSMIQTSPKLESTVMNSNNRKKRTMKARTRKSWPNCSEVIILR